MTIVTTRVLLVDDCLEDRETYRRYLLRDRQQTYRILEAETGEEALLLCRQQFPDVILLDYLLPDVNGLEFLNDLKTQLGQTKLPIIILTGQGDEQVAVQAMKSGAADYLVKKNITVANLDLAIQNVLERTRLSRQLEESELRVQQRSIELQRANQELQIALEELQVAEEEQRQQNEQIATSRQEIELERQRYQDLFEFAPDGYLVTDTWGNIREANRAAATLLSIQQQRLIGKPLLAFIAEQERKSFQTRLAQLQEVQGWEVYLEPCSGDPFPAMVAVSSIHDNNGQQVGWRWLLRDISIRKQMEQRLQAAHDELEKRVEERTAELSRTNALLQQKNELLQTIFDHVPVMLALFNSHGQFRWANREWESVLGWRAEEIQGRDLLAEFYPDPDYRQYVLEFIAAADRRWSDFKTRTRNGKVIDTTWANVRLTDGSNIGIGQDISDRKAAELALRESEARYRTITELTSDYIYSTRITPEGTVIEEWATSNLIKITGYSHQELFDGTRTWFDVIYPDDVPTVRQFFNGLLQQKHSQALEYRIITKHREIRWIRDRIQPQWDESQGRVVRVLGAVEDISDRKLAQEKIREQAALLDVATDAIFVRDLEHRILYWNSGAERLYGWLSAEVVGKICCKFLYKQISPSVEEALKTVVEQGEWHGELNTITKSRQEIIVYSRWTLMQDEAGKPKSILCVDTDITEKKQLQAQFYRAQRLESLGTLASGIAHDLNNILTPILTVAQLLPLKLPNLNQQNQQLLKILEDNSKRGAELVKQITAFARGAEGKHVPIQPRHLLKEIEQVVKSTFPKSIEICINLPMPNLWTILADPTQMHQVLMNLCVNARDAMPNGGTLSISAQNFRVDENYARMNLEAKAGNYVLITVSDTGCGIPQELIERIFEPFFTTKEPGKGTGLGLSTAIGIIKNHDGFVSVYSEVGRGSQFKLFLRAIETSATQETDDSQTVRGNGELILVVDDETFIRDIAKTSLEEFNYRVLIASDGIEAFSLYAQYKHEISLVLMDIQMPSIDGFQAIRILQQINPSVKIIAISGLTSNHKLLEASGISVQAFLPKPYTIKEFLDTIKGVLSAP
ncbi:PAS domain S-box protein [Chlorogloeopsis fritschii PCC 9212]|uniref:histidine kinase n=1 Tax=Chlorogloeopsis fritschii PCC 6912 TaxID=211165 RepID=A0A3S0Y7D0_CHLFR|nr:hybrid sensor histidine kinase/response regulator [Chlorogloeopsis fritschii]RUR87012.1 hypothetical protein PCC6912_04550 [Chlorogloeopsis fritschii PCC 6912]